METREWLMLLRWYSVKRTIDHVCGISREMLRGMEVSNFVSTLLNASISIELQMILKKVGKNLCPIMEFRIKSGLRTWTMIRRSGQKHTEVDISLQVGNLNFKPFLSYWIDRIHIDLLLFIFPNMRSTQRIESMHRNIKSSMTVKQKSYELVELYGQAIIELRVQDRCSEFATIYTYPLIDGIFSTIKSDGVKIYLRYCFHLLCK